MTKRPELPRVRVERELRAYVATLEPGQQLASVPELAARFQVGHGTVRTALAKLASEGLVTVIRAYGTFRAEQPGQPEQNRP